MTLIIILFLNWLLLRDNMLAPHNFRIYVKKRNLSIICIMKSKSNLNKKKLF